MSLDCGFVQHYYTMHALCVCMVCIHFFRVAVFHMLLLVYKKPGRIFPYKQTSLTFVLADARPAALLALAFLCGCVRRCLTHYIACTASRFGDANTCLTPRIAYIDGCVGTFRAISSQIHRLPYDRPLLHATAFGPRCLPRAGDAFASSQSPL